MPRRFTPIVSWAKIVNAPLCSVGDVAYSPTHNAIGAERAADTHATEPSKRRRHHWRVVLGRPVCASTNPNSSCNSQYRLARRISVLRQSGNANGGRSRLRDARVCRSAHRCSGLRTPGGFSFCAARRPVWVPESPTSGRLSLDHSISSAGLTPLTRPTSRTAMATLLAVRRPANTKLGKRARDGPNARIAGGEEPEPPDW